MTRAWMIGLAWVAVAATAAAQVRPVANGSDPMQQSVRYADGQTIILETAPGFQLTVELSPQEHIRTAAAGDSSRWEVSAPANGSQLFVRPAPGAATTNLTVVTDRRTYYFLLVPASAMTHSNPLSVRFTYPPEPAKQVSQPVEASTSPAATYRMTGNHAVRPARLWDDSAKTYLFWAAGAELPAVFAVGPDGSEMLVNGYMRDELFVIDAVYPRLIFRIDRAMARADRQQVKKS